MENKPVSPAYERMSATAATPEDMYESDAKWDDEYGKARTN